MNHRVTHNNNKQRLPSETFAVTGCRRNSHVSTTTTATIDFCSGTSSMDDSARSNGSMLVVDVSPTSSASASTTSSLLMLSKATLSNDDHDDHHYHESDIDDDDANGHRKYNHSRWRTDKKGFDHTSTNRSLFTVFTFIGILPVLLLFLMFRQQSPKQSTMIQHKPLHPRNDYWNNMYHLRTTHQHSSTDVIRSNSAYSDSQCRWYLAESAIPQSGLGIYTGIPLHTNDMIGFPDICIYVADGPRQWTHLRSHTFGRRKFYGQYEGRKSRAACEGIITTVNTVPDVMVNMEMISPILPTNAGLHRATSPGAGAITHHYGIHGKALDTITAGSEITINYGDWDFDDKSNDRKTYPRRPIRDLDWLQSHGWCIDNIHIDISTVPHAGRGAFARLSIEKGTVVAPAPLLVFDDRSIFRTHNGGIEGEQLFVNYCIQPANSKILLFPYGQGVNLINHSIELANVEFRWASNTRNKMHYSEYLDLSRTELFEIVAPGNLILEVVALRHIEQGEELFLNYGQLWDDAWKEHVRNWIPTNDAAQYAYPSEIDETTPVRTIQEQLTNPYPKNLITMCRTHDRERKIQNHLEWIEPKTAATSNWASDMVYCHILERKYEKRIGDDLYTVSLLLDSDNMDTLDYDLDIYMKPYDDNLYIDCNVPRRAIRFIEKPFVDDEHLNNVFRHPIILPEHLVPETWKIQV